MEHEILFAGTDAFSMAGCDATRRPQGGQGIQEVVRRADVVSIHCPLSDATRGLIDRRRIELMKPSAYLVNTARGPIVEQAALIDALRDGRIAGAALDVFDEEPLPVEHPIRRMSNVVLTSHI